MCRLAFAIFLTLGMLPPIALAQSESETSPQPGEIDYVAASNLVLQQFGTGFTPLKDFAPVIGDFDSDGISDIVIPARATNPLVNAVRFHYKVVDPYDTYFGFGDPKVTMEFGANDPRDKGLVLLIIHGAGEKGWHANEPKAKFVVINLPFTKVALSAVKLRKKEVAAIAAEERDTVSSLIYWDGKKYKYEPNGASN